MVQVGDHICRVKDQNPTLGSARKGGLLVEVHAFLIVDREQDIVSEGSIVNLGITPTYMYFVQCCDYLLWSRTNQGAESLG